MLGAYSKYKTFTCFITKDNTRGAEIEAMLKGVKMKGMARGKETKGLKEKK